MLSIIIPTLNEEDYLPYLLDSIRNQTFKDYEIIVADAGSTDRTVKIAKDKGCLVVSGGLPSIGRNKGTKAAKGDLLLFLDADVILPFNFLENILKEFEKRQLDIASCFISPLSGKKVDNLLYGIGNLYYEVNQYIKPQASGFCLLVKKELHRKVKGFDEEIKIGEDWAYTTKSSKKGKFKFLRTARIPVSMRRLERDGRLDVAFQRVTGAVLFYLFGGIKSDALVKYYRFGNYPKKALKPMMESYIEFSDQIHRKFRDKL